MLERLPIMPAPVRTFTLATRDSQLARNQTGRAVARLRGLVPELDWEPVYRSSPGDRDREADLRLAPGDFFTRDLDAAVRAGEVDAALHSAKDLPDPVADDLDWVWLPWRADPRDALVLAPGRPVDELGGQPRIGVSSERREAWARERWPGADLAAIRGNVDARLARLDAGDYDAVIVAGAALERLGLAERATAWIPLAELRVPPGQGALALVFRAGDPVLTDLRALLVPAVRFVGAGVGDARWCTLAGREALAGAEVCLHDALLDERLLAELPANADILPVGKRSGGRGTDQAAIDRLLVDRARRGERVVRLKGGDVAIFGRLAEEIAACESLGLPYEVIPGISSLQLATGPTGMHLTRRGVSRGFTVLTPRLAGGARAPITAAARAEQPLVVFMGTRLLPELVAELLADDLDPTTPAAVVFAAGGPDQKVVRAPLGEVSAAVADRGRDRPGLILVGAITASRAGGGGPLAGQRVLVTVSEALQAEAARRVRDRGGIPVACPVIGLVATEAARTGIAAVTACDWLLVSSPSAVRILAGCLAAAGIGLQHLPRLLAAGPGTARELAAHGLTPDLVPECGFGSEGIVAVAAAIPAGSRILRPRSSRAGAGLGGRLRALDLLVDEPVWFENRSLAPPTPPTHDAAILASPSAVDAAFAAWGPEALAGRVVAIGEPTAAALARRGRKDHLLAAEASLAGCVDRLAAASLARCLEESS